MRAVAFAALALVAATPAARRENLPRLRSNLLVTLPSLGSVTWRCGRSDGVYGLGYREFWASATTEVTLAAGKRTRRKRVDPRGLVVFPLSRAPVQRLTFVQTTEPGTLRAVVVVYFDRSSRGYPPCQAYLPPRTEVHIFPRPNGR